MAASGDLLWSYVDISYLYRKMEGKGRKQEEQLEKMCKGAGFDYDIGDFDSLEAETGKYADYHAGCGARRWNLYARAIGDGLFYRWRKQ